MEKTMYEVTVRREDGFIIITTGDHGFGEQKVIITVDQAQLFIEWLEEAADSIDEEPEV